MLKKLLLSVSVLLLLIIIGITAIVIQPQLLQGAISTGGQRFAGLDITFESLSSHRSPLRLELKGLELRNPDWPEPTLLRLDSLSLKLIASPFDDGAFWSLHSEGLTVNLEHNREGELNWLTSKLRGNGETPPPDTEPSAPAPVQLPGDFNFQEIVLLDSHIHILRADGERYHIDLPEVRGERSETANGHLSLELAYAQHHFLVSGDIVLFDPGAGVLDYQLAIEHEDAQLKSEGRLSLSPDLSGSRIDLSLALQRLEALATMAGLEHAPALPESRLATTLVIDNGYQLSDTTLALGDNTLSGTLTIATDFSQVDATLSSPALNIDALQEIFAPAPQESTQTDATAEPAETAMDWQWLSKPEVKATLAIERLLASGWQLDALKVTATTGEQLSADFSIATVSEAASQRQLNDVTGELRLTPLAPQSEGADARLELALSERGVNIDIEGDVNLNGKAGNALKIRAQAPQSAHLWALAQLPWQEAGALELTGEFASEAQGYTVNSSASLGEQQADVTLEYKTPEALEYGHLDGQLTLKNLSMAFTSPANESASTQTSTPRPRSKKLLSKDPIAFDALHKFEGQLNIDLQDVDTGYTYIKRASLAPSVKKGVLTLSDSRILTNGGEAQLSARLDANGERPQLRSEIRVDGSDYGKLGLEKAAGIRGGTGDIRLNLRASGNSPADLAASLNGQVDIKITDLEAKGNALNLIGSDVLTETFNKLNPFREKRSTTQIECLAVHFKGNDGKFISNDGIALETEASKIIGTGHIDFANEELRFGISPIARKGVGINVGAAAGLVRLGGSFSKPRVEADPGGMFTSGLSTGAAIYTGGLSLVAQGLMKRALYSGSACDGALEEIPSADELPPELLQPADNPAAPASAEQVTQPTS
ncbi:MAG: AsmA family protein [Spongiibacter marinus]|uniref:AsmA family protein n=1 Tax=Spongiibacter marinus TaxID=354246 RepID=UPI003C346300